MSINRINAVSHIPAASATGPPPTTRNRDTANRIHQAPSFHESPAGQQNPNWKGKTKTVSDPLQELGLSPTFTVQGGQIANISRKEQCTASQGRPSGSRRVVISAAIGN